jgi:hypothetical protein
MDMNEKFSHDFHRRKRRRGDGAELAAKLAPLEEQSRRSRKELLGIAQSPENGGASQEYGAIVVDNSAGNLSKDIMEGGHERTFLGMEPVVLVILGVMLTFIVFIAWQISQMPVE